MRRSASYNSSTLPASSTKVCFTFYSLLAQKLDGTQVQVNSAILSDADAEGETDDEVRDSRFYQPFTWSTHLQILTTTEHNGFWSSGHETSITSSQSFASDLGSFPLCDWSRVSLHEVLSSITYKPAGSETREKHDSSVTGTKRKRRSRMEGKPKKRKCLEADKTARDSSRLVPSSSNTTNMDQDLERELLRLDFAFLLNEEEIVDGNLRHLATEASLKQAHRRPKDFKTVQPTMPYPGRSFQERGCFFDEGEISTGPKLSLWFEQMLELHVTQDGIHTTQPQAGGSADSISGHSSWI